MSSMLLTQALFSNLTTLKRLKARSSRADAAAAVRATNRKSFIFWVGGFYGPAKRDVNSGDSGGELRWGIVVSCSGKVSGMDNCSGKCV